ncbi:MAG: trypsin-like peptidase domain-containing protein, partial [Nanoarchaeota archaeon]
MKRKHIVTGVTIFLIVKVLLIISVIYLAITLVTLRNELKGELQQTKDDLQKQILDNKAQTQEQIIELSDNLISTKSDISSQLDEIKAEAGSDFSGIIVGVIPGVVSVGTDVAQGSGFIITSDGYTITNAHVLSGGHYVRVLTYEADSWESASLIGYDTEMDIAIIKISGNEYNYLTFDDSNNLVIGEKVIALGNPLGLSFSVTEGIISGLNREGSNNIPAYIQIDAPLNRGNSGGPLINKKGKVIGINNFKIQGGENIGFALGANYAAEAINK